ncbi:MAG: fatty acid hydroxylase family protein, partial [Novosphingobium sp.]
MVAMTLIVGLRYLASSGLFAWLGERRLPGLHAGLKPQIKREIGWSLLSAGIYGLPAGLVAW